MNAIEFVREFGLFGAKEYLAGATFYKEKLMVFTNMNDLKQIVDAFDLIEKYNGLNASKNTLKLFQSSVDIGLYHGINGVDAETAIPKLKQAIELVEQCNASD